MDVIPQRGLVCFMFANLTGRGTSLVQGSGTFCVPKKVQLCDRLLLPSIFVFMKTLLLEALTRIPQVSSKPAENARIETQRARGKRHLHHFRNCCVFSGNVLQSDPKIKFRRRRWRRRQQRRVPNKFLLAVCKIASDIAAIFFFGKRASKWF